MKSMESSGNSTRLSMDVANLPLTPFGMKHQRSPRKFTSLATNRFNKLSRRKGRDLQEGKRAAEYGDKENIGGFNSQHRKQWPVGDPCLVGLHTVPEEKNCPESSCISEVKGPMPCHSKDSQLVANLRPTVDSSVASKTQSTTDTPIESTGRRDSVYTDIDDGSFIEFCHGKEKGHYVPCPADDPSRKINFYYTCETNNDTEYSTSTKMNNALVGFRKYLDKLRIQRNLRNVWEDNETEEVRPQDNVNMNNLLDETVITCSADMRKFLHKGPPPAAVNSTVMDNLPHDKKVPLPHVFSEVSTLTIQSEMAVCQEPQHQSNHSQGQPDKHQIVVLSDSSDEESHPAADGGDYGSIDFHSNTRGVLRSDSVRVPPINRNDGDAKIMPVCTDIADKVKVLRCPPSPELVASVSGKYPSLISEDISIISSTQELHKASRQVVPKTTDMDVLTIKEAKVPVIYESQKNVESHNVSCGHATHGRYLSSVKSNADKQISENATDPVNKWVMSSPFKESSFDSSFLQWNEDSFISESPSQPKLDPRNESYESHEIELNYRHLTNPDYCKEGINLQSFGKSHDPSVVEKSKNSDDNGSECDFAVKRTTVTQRVIVSTSEESEDDRRTGRYVTQRRKKKLTKIITESFEKDCIEDSDSEKEESLCLRLSKSQNETNRNSEKTTQTIGKAATSPETRVKNFSKTNNQAPQWLKKSNRSCHEGVGNLKNDAPCSHILHYGATKEPLTTLSPKTGNSKYTGNSDGPLDLSLIRKELDDLYTTEWRKNENAIFKAAPKERQQESKISPKKSFKSNKRRSMSCPRLNLESEEENSFLHKVSETSGDGDGDTNSSEEERYDSSENNKSNKLNSGDEKVTKMTRPPDSPEEDSFEEYLKKAKALTQKKHEQESRYYYEDEDCYEPSFINDESSDNESYSLPSVTQKSTNIPPIYPRTSVSKNKDRGREEERHENSRDEVNLSDKKDKKNSKTTPKFEEDSFEEYLKRAKVLTQQKKQYQKVLHSDDSEDQHESSFITDDSSDDESYRLPPPIQKSPKILSENSGFPKLKKQSRGTTGKNTGPKATTNWRDSPTITLTSDSDSDEFYSLTKPFAIPRTKPRGKVLPKTEGPCRRFVKKYETGHLSPRLPFLVSLSSNVNIIQCHPEALPYIKDFKKKKEELAEKLYKYYNTHVFDDKLPSSMNIKWNVRLRKTAGYCYYQINKSAECRRGSRIELSTKVIDCAERLRDTLIHEMCHAAAWIISGYKDGHGPLWKAWAGKARAVFPELPAINRCHSYQIQCKYTYRCTRCSYSIGRHSKSLDTNRKVCGLCLGKFELLVNSKTQKDKSKTTPGITACNPRTPKTPGPFALFVKENYGSVKKSTPNVKHGDVMRILSAKFEKMKTGGGQALSS
uniref:SprT-like domain-containing protein n=1 Tax=Scylla olivacea TaxID=85551 RepID=A0A0N7ZDR3_SCYOL